MHESLTPCMRLYAYRGQEILNAERPPSLTHPFSFPLVVDPVMISKHGAPLMIKEAREVFKKEFLPHATLVTPNLYEAQELAGFPVRDLESMERAAKAISSMGSRAVLVKGGHLENEAVDLLYWENKTELLHSPWIDSTHTHGSGCTFSAVITAELAKGVDLLQAVRTAKKFITNAIATSPNPGSGNGPVDHHVVI